MKAQNQLRILNTKFRKKLMLRDVGSIFWRVEYSGSLAQYEIISVDIKGQGTHRIRFFERHPKTYKLLKLKNKSMGVSIFGLNIIRKKEFFTDLNEAKKQAEKGFYKYINPHGRYVVNQYFDSIFERRVTGELSKTEAQDKAIHMNKIPRCYVHFRAESVK